MKQTPSLIRLFIIGFVVQAFCFTSHVCSQTVTIEAAPLQHLNSEQNEHSLWIGGQFLMFSSDRNPGFSYKETETRNEFERIFVSEKQGKYFRMPEEKRFSQLKNHYSIAGQSDNPDIILIYSGHNETGDIYLYRVRPGKNKFSVQKMLFSPELQDIRKTSAFLNERTGELFFCANIEDDSFGNRDIFVSSMNKNKWGNPINLGKNINSTGDEEGVFMNGDTLFFSSNGHQSEGVYDIYMSIRTGGMWSEAVKLPEPVNSSSNDMYYVSQGSEVFFVSDRPGGKGGLDIYQIIRHEIPEPVIEAPQVYTKIRSGRVLDDETGEIIRASITLMNAETGELLKNTGDQGFRYDMISGSSYKMIVSAEGYHAYEETYNLEELLSDTIDESDIRLKKIPVISEIPPADEDNFVSSFKQVLKEIPFRIIYYQVQVGAFRFIHDIPKFRQSFPSLNNEALMIEKEGEISKFLITKKFFEKDANCYAEVTTLQIKVVKQYGISDAFIVAYAEDDKRFAIIWSFEEQKYILLKNTE